MTDAIFPNPYSPVFDVSADDCPVMLGGYFVTDYVPRANILDIRIGAAGIQNTALARGQKAGSDFFGRRHTTRTIEIEIELPLDRNTYPGNVQLIRAWADSPQPREMILSAYRDRKIMVSCTNANQFSQKEWWLPVVLKFEAWDPYFISLSPRTANIGEEFYIAGDAEPMLYISHDIENDASITNPKWTLDHDKHVGLNREFSGGKLTINFDNGSIDYNGESVMNSLTITSRISPFAKISPGRHIIDGPTGGIVSWYERWL